ncbi:hypothetical protein C8R45DRAFT_1084223 [Mycena sanguinolenta]|nr:hypothetical protein C8R45DRAFT_1084223 [Mycena sanguinolenta]
MCAGTARLASTLLLAPCGLHAQTLARAFDRTIFRAILDAFIWIFRKRSAPGCRRTPNGRRIFPVGLEDARRHPASSNGSESIWCYSADCIVRIVPFLRTLPEPHLCGDSRVRFVPYGAAEVTSATPHCIAVDLAFDFLPRHFHVSGVFSASQSFTWRDRSRVQVRERDKSTGSPANDVQPACSRLRDCAGTVSPTACGAQEGRKTDPRRILPSPALFTMLLGRYASNQPPRSASGFDGR